MRTLAASDPIQRLGRAERRSWRRLERHTRRAHEADQMEALQVLAALGVTVTGMRTPEPLHPLQQCAPVELLIAGRRLRAGRVPRRTLATLREGLGSIAAVPLTAVGRYGPYWVLTFRLATEQLVVLAEHLTLLPEWGGSGGRGIPTGPVAQLVG
jgi:hypothetical protein